MSWWTPQLAATLWAMFQALVILLVVGVVGGALTVVERRLLASGRIVMVLTGWGHSALFN